MRALVLACLTCLALAGAAHADTPAADRVDAYLDATWPSGAGGTVLAGRGDRIVTCRGFGLADRARHRRATCDTVYDLMSMTKPFTAAAILKLEMLGRLRASDPIERFLGPVPADKRSITIAQLLAHTSGLPEALGDDYDPIGRDALVAAALAAPLRSTPGATYAYSNVGYSLLAAIVEHASGLGYEQFLRRHLFLPAGMRQTGYVLPRWRRARVAIEYDRRGRSQGRPFDHPWAPDGPYWHLRGNGGLLSTARDMWRWHRALEGNRVLSARAKREYVAPRAAVREPGYEGYASAYAGGVLPTPAGPIIAHTGGNGWSFGVAARFPRSHAAVFWVTNQATRAGRWNLERLDQRLTLGIGRRLLPG